MPLDRFFKYYTIAERHPHYFTIWKIPFYTITMVYSAFQKKSRLGDQLLREMRSAQFVVCGETHGVTENLLVYRSLLQTGIFQAFAYELFHKWENGLNAYLSHAARMIPKEISKEWRAMSAQSLVDGKVSQEFVAFLGWLRKRNETHPQILLICFEQSSYRGAFSWNKRDRILAQNLVASQKRLGAGARMISQPILVATGQLHARQNSFLMRSECRYPLGYYIKEKSCVFITLRYASGSYFNITRRAFPVKEKISTHVLSLSKERNQYYITIPKATPVTPIASEREFAP